jgi:hypothetical protein
MRVRATLTLEIDSDAWIDTYGPNDSVREDVRRYVFNQITGSPAAEEGAIRSVKDS